MRTEEVITLESQPEPSSVEFTTQKPTNNQYYNNCIDTQ